MDAEREAPAGACERGPGRFAHRVALLVWALAVLGAGFSTVVAAQAAARGASDEGSSEKRGYWWKKEETTEDGEGQGALLPPPPSEEQLLKLHPKDVAKLIDEYRDNALYTMKPEQVAWYYQLQDFARRRARAFMNVTSYVMLQDPRLNMNTVYSDSPPGQEARRAEYEQSINQRLDQERGSAGLLFFVRQGCQYCEAQRTELNYFQDRHHWDIKEVDVGKDPRAAAHFGVTYTPTILVAFRETGEWKPVSVGVDTVPKIEESLYDALRMLHGETSPDRYDLQEYQDGGPYDPNRPSLSEVTESAPRE